MSMAPAVQMDRSYRFIRHAYHPSRRSFLPGRNRLLEEMQIRPGERVLPVGYYTARKLMRPWCRCPEARLFGIDASTFMLESAHRAPGHPRIDGVILRPGIAEALSPRHLELQEPFDRAFYSYALSMMPRWDDALDAAWSSLRPGGTLHMVYFWVQHDLPAASGMTLRGWLRLFKAVCDPALVRNNARLGKDGEQGLPLRPLYRRYASLAADCRPAAG